VRVVNFVSQGTIEEGMLSILKFKKSLFAGVLDEGEKEVFLGGSRLNRFMETVQKTTEAIPQPPAQDPPQESEGDGQLPVPESQRLAQPQDSPAVFSSDPWSGLVKIGLEFLQRVTAGGHALADGRSIASAGLSLIHRDPQTGESYLRIPAPKPEVLQQVFGAIGMLMEQFKK
jgi:hypothetical protein